MSTESDSFDYDSISPGYYDVVFRRRSGIQSKWHHLKFARVCASMGSYGSHLDIACGPGTLIGTLASHSPSVGVDIAPDQIRYAERTYGTPDHRFEQIEEGTLPFPEATYDIVTLLDVIEHLTENEANQLLLETHRVLRPGGRVLIGTPNFASLWPAVEWFVNRLGEVSYEHQHILHFDPQRPPATDEVRRRRR